MREYVGYQEKYLHRLELFILLHIVALCVSFKAWHIVPMAALAASLIALKIAYKKDLKKFEKSIDNN